MRTPHYGGHVERLIGTVMGKVHLLPGTTFSDVRTKGDRDPEKTSAMAIEELERWLTHAITGVYHRTVQPLLDVVSCGRGSPGETNGRLTSARLEQIQRTVRRALEVVVKMSPASDDLKGGRKHFDYIGRRGELELETDDGERSAGGLEGILWKTGT